MQVPEYCTRSEKQNGWVSMVVSGSVIYTQDHEAGWELRLAAAAAQNDKRLSYSTLLAWEEIKIQSTVLPNIYLFDTIVKSKNSKLNH